MEDVQVAGITEPRQGERFSTFVRWLSSKDFQKREKAIAMFCQVGKGIVPALIQETIRPGKRSQHRIAILEVIEQIGGPVGFDDMCRLQSLLGQRAPSVCQKAAEVIMSLGPGGPPKSPEDAAAMLDSNPFLRPPLTRQALRGDPDLARWRAEFNAERRKERDREHGRM